jgi:hypothetical protein
MRKVYSSKDVNLVHFARSVLEAHQIDSVILREQLTGAVGGLAPLDTWPELWVHDADELEQASQLIAAAMKMSETQQTAWICHACGEKIEPQFTQCWQCDTEQMTTAS